MDVLVWNRGTNVLQMSEGSVVVTKNHHATNDLSFLIVDGLPSDETLFGLKWGGMGKKRSHVLQQFACASFNLLKYLQNDAANNFVRN